MAPIIIPTQLDVGNIAGASPGIGQVITEVKWNLMHSRGYFPYVISGYALPAPAANLNLVLPAGVAWIDGYYVNDPDGATLSLSSNSFNRVFLTLHRSSGLVDGITWVVRTDTVIPDDALIICEVLTGASTQTAIDDRNVFNATERGRSGLVRGRYRGSGTSSREVVLGFKPYHLIMRWGANSLDLFDGYPTTSIVVPQNHGFQANGTTGTDANQSGTIYSYEAW